MRTPDKANGDRGTPFDESVVNAVLSRTPHIHCHVFAQGAN
jgi:hypothetical protein